MERYKNCGTKLCHSYWSLFSGKLILQKLNSIEVKAYGKVNLGLDVTGKRDDGYHLVKMVMQTVDVFDEITVSRKDPEGPPLSLTCSWKDPGKALPEGNDLLPADSSNLAWKAAELIRREYGLTEGIHVDIRKNIPMAAGMAGGSADGAAVIKAMDRLFELGMSEVQMDRLAVKLGADVPFCLRHGTYLAEGIGEKLTRLCDLPHCYMVIVKPDFGISTPWAYKALDDLMEHETVIHPDIDALTDALQSGNIEEIAGKMGNILEFAAIKKFPGIQKIKDMLSSYGAVISLMSGSGPTVFGIFKDREMADAAYGGLEGGEYGKFKVEF